MGLFVREDGYYQTWVAGLLCCCAAVGSDEHPAELSSSKSNNKSGIPITHEQPPIYSLPPYTQHPPHTAHSTQEPRSAHDSVNDSREQLKIPSPYSERSNSYFTPRSNGVSDRLPRSDRSHQNLVPLKLAPVVLCDRSHIDHEEYNFSSSQHQRSGSDDALLPSTVPESYRQSRETPFQRLVRRSTDVLATRSPAEDFDLHSSQTGMRSLRHRQSADDVASAASSRSSMESSTHPSSLRLKHKLSSPAVLRLGNISDADTDGEEGIELSAIVEEQKQDSPSSTRHHNDTVISRPTLPSRSDNHIPAVAPLMEMHVRSETLNDIGSAFSRPLTARSDRKNFDELLLEEEAETDTRRAHARSRSRSQVAGIRSRSGQRVSGWLNSRRNGSSSASDAIPDIDRGIASTNRNEYINGDSMLNRPIPEQRPRKYSLPSSSSIATLPDSPLSVTAASSPISVGKGRHSRTMTADSKITSPPATVYEPVRKAVNPRFEENDALSGRDRALATATDDTGYGKGEWPMLKQSRSQVGLAL